MSGKRYRLSHDFEGNFNAVVIPYFTEQQVSVDTWTLTLQRLAEQFPTFRFYELPVLPNYSWLQQQRYIDAAMRSGIRDKTVCDRTITLYLDVADFNRSLGLLGIHTMYTLLVDRAGTVIWRAIGAYTPEKGDDLRRIWPQWQRPQRVSVRRDICSTTSHTGRYWHGDIREQQR